MANSNHGDTAVFALGGLGEIGKNLYCVETDSSLVLIDSGVMFPESDYPGIDYVIPDYTYIIQNAYKLKALVITHGHEDHIGGIPFLIQKVNVPIIYAPRLAAAFIKHKLEEFRIHQKVRIIEIDGDSSFKVGDMTIDAFSTTHSIPDSLGFRITTPNGKIFTTGDFKIDLTPVGGQHIDLHKIAKFGQEGIDLMLSDSTNAEVPGISLSERDVVNSIHDVFNDAPGRLIVATFASNIHRIQQIVETAVAFKRKILVFGRSMERTLEIGRKYGYIKCPDASLIMPETLRAYKPEELLILCTGSQGEPLAALSRIANDSHKYLKIAPGDTVVFSSSPIPGNAQSINHVVNALCRRGANVLTNSILTNIHASGHASQEELKYMLSLVTPHYFMPIHGEYRMLKIHSEIAQELGVPADHTFVLSNGDVVLLHNGVCRLGRRVETDDIYVDGKDSSGLSTAVIRDRKILANDGVVSVLIAMDSHSNRLLSKPIIVSRGFMHLVGNEDFNYAANKVVTAALEELFKGKVTFSAIKNTIRSTLSSYIYNKTNRNPMIIPVIMNKVGEPADLESPQHRRSRQRNAHQSKQNAKKEAPSNANPS